MTTVSKLHEDKPAKVYHSIEEVKDAYLPKQKKRKGKGFAYWRTISFMSKPGKIASSASPPPQCTP